MHPYTGDWFGFLSKYWYTVTCSLWGCKICKRDTFDCTEHTVMDVRHLIESRLLTRGVE